MMSTKIYDAQLTLILCLSLISCKNVCICFHDNDAMCGSQRNRLNIIIIMLAIIIL